MCCYALPGPRCSVGAQRKMEASKHRAWVADVRARRVPTPANREAKRIADEALLEETERWAQSPVGLIWYGKEVDKAAWGEAKQKRVLRVLAQENARRRARAAALRTGAVEKEPWKANTGDKNERYGEHRALFPPNITAAQIDTLRREYATTNHSVLVAITRNRKTSSDTLRTLLRHENSEVQSCARLALERRSKHWAASRAGRRARAAAAKAQGASQPLAEAA